MKFNAQVNALNINCKGNKTNHPSISKYTNNPYKATSTLNFYNNINDIRVMGKYPSQLNTILNLISLFFNTNFLFRNFQIYKQLEKTY